MPQSMSDIICIGTEIVLLSYIHPMALVISHQENFILYRVFFLPEIIRSFIHMTSVTRMYDRALFD